mgnify:CR=1 FL=1
MNKVGIITFHCADNFGAVLQAYSLQEVVAKMGFEPEIIDFRPDRIVDNYSIFFNNRKSIEKIGLSRTIKKYLSNIKNIKDIKRRMSNFNNFRNEFLKLSSNTYYTSNELLKNPPKYNYYITGSDQVWNPHFFSEIGESYFLDFAINDSIKISYAASIANQIEDKYLEVFKKKLKKIWLYFNKRKISKKSNW